MGVRREERMTMSVGSFLRIEERPLRIGPDIARGDDQWREGVVYREGEMGREEKEILVRGKAQSYLPGLLLSRVITDEG
jgi:hypothetical protein